jgi:hypothetical protein
MKAEEDEEEVDELDLHWQWYTDKMNKFGEKCATLIDHVEKVNHLNLELASELEKVYTELAVEKASKS